MKRQVLLVEHAIVYFRFPSTIQRFYVSGDTLLLLKLEFEMVVEPGKARISSYRIFADSIMTDCLN